MPTRRSLGARLAIRVGVVSALLFTVLTALSLANEFRETRQARLAESRGAIDLIKGPLALALWNLDRAAVDLLLQQLASASLNVQASVLDARGQAFGAATRHPPEPPEGAPIEIELTDPRGQQTIGRLVVQQSERTLRSNVLALALRTGAFELAKLLAVVACIVLVLQGLVLRRLKALVTQVRNLDPGDPSSRLHDIGGDRVYDEIGALVRAGNDSLQAQRSLAQAEADRQKAEAADRAKSQLLSRVGHELRTPMNAILGYTQLLSASDEAGEPKSAQAVERITLAGWHLSRLIDDLLDLSRVEGGQWRLVAEPCDAGSVARDCLALLESDAAAAGVAIELHVAPGGLPPVLADPLRLRQVLVNLMSNAIKYNAAGGRATLALHALSATQAEFVVEDTGLGLTPAQLDGLFEPFNRLGRERSGVPGTGLGLVISRALVRQMGGEIVVTSRAGVGSVFRVRLPFADPATPRAAPPAEAAATAGAGLRGRVLYVEDDLVNTELLLALLRRRPQVDCAGAATVAEGLAALERGPVPDLVLLDLNLPDGSGETLLQALRERPEWRGVRAAVMSADTSPETLARVRKSGANAFIAKPLDFEQALADIDRLLLPRQGT